MRIFNILISFYDVFFEKIVYFKSLHEYTRHFSNFNLLLEKVLSDSQCYVSPFLSVN